MKFYDIKQFDKPTPESGVDAMKAAKAFEVIGKDSRFKTLDSIEKYNFVFLYDGSFVQNETHPIDFVHENTKRKNSTKNNGSFALIKKGQLFNIEYNRELYFAKIHNGNLFIESTLKEIDALTTNNIVLNPLETKVYDWLENGETGLSSKAICKFLFPNLAHHDLDKMNYEADSDYHYDYELTAHPHDNSDFRRCQQFLSLDPEIKNRFSEVSILSDEWAKLVSNWDKIETHIANNESTEAYQLIKESINIKKPKP